MFLFLNQMYRYYFSNKHLPILFFSPNPFYRNKRFIDYINHLGNEISNVNIGEGVRTTEKHRVKDSGITFSKKNFLTSVSNAKRNESRTNTFDPVFERGK